MIRLIVRLGDKDFSGENRLGLNYRVFEFENEQFENLLKGENPQLHVVGLEVFDVPKGTAPALPAAQGALPLAVPVPSDPAGLKATLATKHANGHAPWWIGGDGDWRGRKRAVKPLKLPG